MPIRIQRKRTKGWRMPPDVDKRDILPPATPTVAVIDTEKRDLLDELARLRARCSTQADTIERQTAELAHAGRMIERQFQALRAVQRIVGETHGGTWTALALQIDAVVREGMRG